MTITLSAAARTAKMTALVTELGASAQLRLYNGTKPASLGAPAGTLLATLVGGTTIGTVAAGVLTFGAFTQTNSSHVSGTPTFARLTKSDGTAVMDVDIGTGSTNLQFTGTVANGQNVAASGLTLTEANA